ncbi:uncharacterized protein HMPREF1541_00061 [Cyphellophora europaea CBS 101466]|uniref:Zn(2)-C6 fungal-type domain-containing protein n=1 Tax=Cyphellophora europaea (strain CBS 101466) TaxID=1220924 RepID=W2SBA6_CYPE1|nr:uncharacterized protein HMPREF1541_00061 [Cyphellophora europaea CBS 101466]ETN45880.1 hypothetical protein HMPREF1541_00061 [Cyphellophora europaea CBS 101466]
MQHQKLSKKSANTCAECRSRKVKCDGLRDVCSPCSRLNISCSFQRGDGDAEAAPERRRARLACEACHSLKARCTGELPECKRCRLRGVDCIYPASKRASARPGSRSKGRMSMLSPDESAETDMRSRSQSTYAGSTPAAPRVYDVSASSLDDGLVMRMFEAFFQHIHPIPLYSFFHKASLIQAFEADLLQSGLVLSIIGMTCQLLDMGPGMKDYGTQCLREAEKLVMEDIGKPSLVKIQVLILLVRHHAQQRRFSNAFVLLALASRFAYALRLNRESPNLCFLAQESRRRMMWSLFIIDTTLAGGIRELVLSPTSSLHIQLPCQERNFEFDLAQETEPLQPKPQAPLSDSVGSLGMYVRVLWLRHRILETTKEAAMYGTELDQLQTRMASLAAELDAFEASLPLSFRLSEKNIQLRAYSPRLCPYLLVHIWWLQSYCDLYRIVLSGLEGALSPEQSQLLDPGFVTECRRRCFNNAKALSGIFRTFRALKNGCPVMELEVFACAYQCARIIFYFYHNSGAALELSADVAQELAQQCLSAMETVPVSCAASDGLKADLVALLDRGHHGEPPTTGTRRRIGTRSGGPSRKHRASVHKSLARQGEGIDPDHIDSVIAPEVQAAPVSGTASRANNTAKNEHEGSPAEDFSISNAFQGAFDGLDLASDPMTSDPFGWLIGEGVTAEHLAWNG